MKANKNSWVGSNLVWDVNKHLCAGRVGSIVGDLGQSRSGSKGDQASNGGSSGETHVERVTKPLNRRFAEKAGKMKRRIDERSER